VTAAVPAVVLALAPWAGGDSVFALHCLMGLLTTKRIVSVFCHCAQGAKACEATFSLTSIPMTLCKCKSILNICCHFMDYLKLSIYLEIEWFSQIKYASTFHL